MSIYHLSSLHHQLKSAFGMNLSQERFTKFLRIIKVQLETNK